MLESSPLKSRFSVWGWAARNHATKSPGWIPNARIGSPRTYSVHIDDRYADTYSTRGSRHMLFDPFMLSTVYPRTPMRSIESKHWREITWGGFYVVPPTERMTCVVCHTCHILPVQPIPWNRCFPSESVKSAQNGPESISEGSRIWRVCLFVSGFVARANSDLRLTTRWQVWMARMCIYIYIYIYILNIYIYIYAYTIYTYI